MEDKAVMTNLEEKQIKKSLEEALWQVEEAKSLNLSITKAMNFINLSKEAQGYGNIRLALGLLTKAKDQLFNDIVNSAIGRLKDDKDVISKMRLERAIKDARERYHKGDLGGAYELILKKGPNGGKEEGAEDLGASTPQLYSEAIDQLQKVWLKMKQEEDKGKDMTKAQSLVKDAKMVLANGDYRKVLDLCGEVMDAIQW